MSYRNGALTRAAAQFRSAVLCVVLAGCVASGIQVKEEQLNQFQRGKTTYSEVVAALGAPTSTSLLPDGRRMAIYTYIHSQARPETFIPIVGPLVGGADARSNSATLFFDGNGTLISYSTTATQVGSGLGVAAGAPINRTPNQPAQAP